MSAWRPDLRLRPRRRRMTKAQALDAAAESVGAAIAERLGRHLPFELARWIVEESVREYENARKREAPRV